MSHLTQLRILAETKTLANGKRIFVADNIESILSFWLAAKECFYATYSFDEMHKLSSIADMFLIIFPDKIPATQIKNILSGVSKVQDDSPYFSAFFDAVIEAVYPLKNTLFIFEPAKACEILKTQSDALVLQEIETQKTNGINALAELKLNTSFLNVFSFDKISFFMELEDNAIDALKKKIITENEKQFFSLLKNCPNMSDFLEYYLGITEKHINAFAKMEIDSNTDDFFYSVGKKGAFDTIIDALLGKIYTPSQQKPKNSSSLNGILDRLVGFFDAPSIAEFNRERIEELPENIKKSFVKALFPEKKENLFITTSKNVIPSEKKRRGRPAVKNKE